MDIIPLGHSSFRLKGKNATVVTDPYESSAVGMKFPKGIAADVITVSHGHPDHNATTVVDGSPFVVSGPGEYEIKGIGVLGNVSYHDNEKGAKRGKNTIYRIEIDGVSVVHLGDLGYMLSSDEIDALHTVDILLIPTGGVYTLDATQASQLVSEIEPSVVIPMHYGRPELDPKTFADLAPVAAFLKAMGKTDVVAQSKVSYTKDKLPEEMQVVVLE